MLTARGRKENGVQTMQNPFLHSNKKDISLVDTLRHCSIHTFIVATSCCMLNLALKTKKGNEFLQRGKYYNLASQTVWCSNILHRITHPLHAIIHKKINGCLIRQTHNMAFNQKACCPIHLNAYMFTATCLLAS